MLYLHSTATEHALDDVTCIALLSRDPIRSPCYRACLAAQAIFPVLVGVTIAFSVLCNDDCYRASLAMHTDAASLINFATLLQRMCLCA